MRPHSCGMYIVLVGDLTCCVTAICVPVSPPPGYKREGASRATGEWTGAQVMIHGSGERDRVTGGNNVIESSPLYAHHPYLADRQSCWPTWEPLLHLGISLEPVISHRCQPLIPMSTGHWPANTHWSAHEWAHTHLHAQAHSSTPSHAYITASAGFR